MKISKRQLRRIIAEARGESFSPMKSRAHPSIRTAVRKQRAGHIQESWGDVPETGSSLIAFAHA